MVDAPKDLSYVLLYQEKIRKYCCYCYHKYVITITSKQIKQRTQLITDKSVKINISCKIQTYLLTSNIFNQYPLRYKTVLKLVFIPMEVGTSSSAPKSYFGVNGCGSFKLESKHHHFARYLSLPKTMGNASCHP